MIFFHLRAPTILEPRDYYLLYNRKAKTSYLFANHSNHLHLILSSPFSVLRFIFYFLSILEKKNQKEKKRQNTPAPMYDKVLFGLFSKILNVFVQKNIKTDFLIYFLLF
jgi:hypothetical protein